MRIRFSPRYVLPSLALAVLAAVPIGIHAIRAPVQDPCPGFSELLATSRVGGGRVTARRDSESGAPGTGILDGTIDTPAGLDAELRFRVDRDVEPSAFFGQTRVVEFDASYPRDGGVETDEVRVGDTTLFIHRTEDRFSSNYRIRIHSYVLGDRPVSSVFGASLRHAIEQLRVGVRPVTLFLLEGRGRISDAPKIGRAAMEWLPRAWQQYREACGGS